MGYPNISLESAIDTLVRWTLPRFTTDQVLLVKVSMSLNYYGETEEDEVNLVRDVHFAIVRPTNYTAVYVAEYDLYENRPLIPCNTEELNNANWEQKSYHDSCWRSDGIGSTLSNIANSMYDDLTKLSDGKADRRNSNMHVSFGLGGGPTLYRGYIDRETKLPVFEGVIKETGH